MTNIEKKLLRSRTDRILFGVSGGLGRYFNLDPIIFRVIFILLAFFQGLGIILYIIMIFIMPLEPEVSDSASLPSDAPGGNPGAPESEKLVNAEKLKEFAQAIGSRGREMAEEFKEYQNDRIFSPARLFFGIILIVLGLYYLGKNFGFLPALRFNWGQLWPFIIVLIGISVFTGRRWATVAIVFLFSLIIIGLIAALIASGMFHPMNFYMMPFGRY